MEDQKITGTLGSPSATTSLDGKQLPPLPPTFGGVIKKSATDIHAGVSIDQVMARKVGHVTRFPSLELSCDSVHKAGHCDTGYSCAYQYNISWQSPTTPMAYEANPRLVFERLFGSGSPGLRSVGGAGRVPSGSSPIAVDVADVRTWLGRVKVDDEIADAYPATPHAVQTAMTICGLCAGSSQRRTVSSSPAGRLTQPFVGPPMSSCRKIADPRPGTAGCALYSTKASSR